MATDFPILVKTLSGLETVLEKELSKLGAKNLRILKRAVACEGDWKLVYQLNLQLRTALRVLLPIHQFQARNEQQLYKGVQQVDWSRYMKVSQTIAINALGRSPVFRHSHFAALKTKDAIVDQFRKRVGRRPSVNTENPHLRVNVHIDRTNVSLSLDSSGNSLHQRGYRRVQGHAPLNEVLAAGMILLSGWEGTTPFLDPMCGSGSLLIEAGMLAGNRPPGLNRSFGFERWKDFQADLWAEVIEEAKSSIQPIQVPILGRDQEPKVIRKARENLSWAGLLEEIEVEKANFMEAPAPEEIGTLIMNPPYGERMGSGGEIEIFYKAIGDTLKQHYAGAEAWIISSNSAAMKRIGLRPDHKHTLFNGALECRYYGYKLYRGSQER